MNGTAIHGYYSRDVAFVTSNVRSISAPDATEDWIAADRQLAEMIADPSSAVDPDAIPPVPMTIRTARRALQYFRQQGWPAPSIVTADGNGGIACEWHWSGLSNLLEIARDQTLRLSAFAGGRMRTRRNIDL